MLIIKKFPNVIKNIVDNSNPNNPISRARAVEIVKDLVLSYYYTYYLDNIYVPGSAQDYIQKIYQMILHGTTSTIFESKDIARPSTHSFFSQSPDSFKFIFDLNTINEKKMIDIIASISFHHRYIYSDKYAYYNPAWSLRLSSIRNEITSATIKTFTFLQDIFSNYDPSVTHFSISFHKPGVSGINYRTTLNNRIPSKYKSDEIKGTFIDVDRSNPQSVIDAIASIVYYMQKYNAFVMVKEGLNRQRKNTVVICFDQRKIYQPDILQPIQITSENYMIPSKFLSPYSEAHYNNWAYQYDDKFFSAANTFPLYLFHENYENELPQLIVDSLSIYLGVKSRIIKLSQ